MGAYSPLLVALMLAFAAYISVCMKPNEEDVIAFIGAAVVAVLLWFVFVVIGGMFIKSHLLTLGAIVIFTWRAIVRYRAW